MKSKLVLVLSILILFVVNPSSFAGQLVPWGTFEVSDYCAKYCNIPLDFNSPVPGKYIDVSAKSHNILAIKEDGSLAAWGLNAYFGQCEVPEGNDFVKVAVGHSANYALRSDGTLLGWGYDERTDVPEGNDFVDVDACIALKSDGSLVSWGDYAGEPPSGDDYIDISAWSHFLALRENGSIVEWRQNYFGRDCNIPGLCDPPQGIFKKISAGGRFSLALKDDGSIVAWLWTEDDWGILNVPDSNDFVGISAGGYHGVAIKSDGTLIAWGRNLDGQCDVPDGNDFVAVASGLDYSIALTSDVLRTLTMSTNPDGLESIVPGQGSHSYYSGQRVLVSAPRCPVCPDVYKFDHWEGDIDDPNASSQYLTMNRDRTITAFYTADERVCGDECHPILTGDLNEDCYINFEDFAIYTQMWMECTHPDCD